MSIYYSEHLSTCSFCPCFPRGKGQALISCVLGLHHIRGTPKLRDSGLLEEGWHLDISVPTAFSPGCKQILPGLAAGKISVLVCKQMVLGQISSKSLWSNRLPVASKACVSNKLCFSKVCQSFWLRKPEARRNIKIFNGNCLPTGIRKVFN